MMGPGENAGAVDVGGGLACAFKVESHNHPSAVEPFQGAATGVGGILRDIFAIGARPIAVLDSLRFGEVEGPGATRTRYLLDGAVSGIGHYGNSIGVPTVGGEVYFEGPYEHNCLVNAMALGLAQREALVRSAAAGTGNVLVLFGASTGRDGIGGASVLASAELAEADTGAGGDGQAPDGAGRRPVRGEEAAGVLARAARARAARLPAGPRRGGADVARRRRWPRRARSGSTSTSTRVPLREADMEPFEVMVSRVPGADAVRGRAGQASRRCWRCARSGRSSGAAIGTVTDTQRDAHHGERRAARRHAGARAGRRLPAV